MNNSIVFGTDGWRARMDAEFTLDNVARVSQAYADTVLTDLIKQFPKQNLLVVVGYDNRQDSELYARCVSEVLSTNGIKVLHSASSCSTPAVSSLVVLSQAIGGIMITASHNPPEYNGYKIKEHTGCSAGQSITSQVQRRAEQCAMQVLRNADPALITTMEFTTSYLSELGKTIDLDLIQHSKLRVLIEPMHGSGSNYFATLFPSDNNPGLIDEVHNQRDINFGGHNPEPLAVNIPETIKQMQGGEYDLGIVLDGDGDRLGAIDQKGNFINSQEVFVLLAYHLLSRGDRGNIARAFNVTQVIDRLAEDHGCGVIETKIGFKYLAEQLLNKKAFLAGEESGGYGYFKYLPERDGVYNGLLLMELLASTGKSLRAILEDIYSKFGRFYYHRTDLHIDSNEKKDAIMAGLQNTPPAMILGQKVIEHKNLDGEKFYLEDKSWILFRKSGTEPLLRVYAEGNSMDEVQALLGFGRELARG